VEAKPEPPCLEAGESQPKEVAPYRAAFHEPFALFGYLAALTPLELVPSVIILPQRQTALVAKQAAEIDVLTEKGFSPPQATVFQSVVRCPWLEPLP